MFLDCATQWNFAGMAGLPTGMNYQGVLAMMELRGIHAAERSVLFDDLREMEAAYLKTLASLK